MELPYEYERFVCDAFGLAAGRRLDRQEDPAHFADADVLTAGSLNAVKVTTGYAMGIICRRAVNKDMSDYEMMDGYISRVIAAESAKEVVAVIEDFKANIVEVYFNRVNDELQPK